MRFLSLASRSVRHYAHRPGRDSSTGNGGAMEDVLGYQGKQVVVTGAASGMGQATAAILVDLGARVVSIDVKPTDVAVAEHLEVDLRDPRAIDRAVASIDGSVHAVFSVAGLPGAPFSDL